MIIIFCCWLPRLTAMVLYIRWSDCFLIPNVFECIGTWTELWLLHNTHSCMAPYQSLRNTNIWLTKLRTKNHDFFFVAFLLVRFRIFFELLNFCHKFALLGSIRFCSQRWFYEFGECNNITVRWSSYKRHIFILNIDLYIHV